MKEDCPICREPFPCERHGDRLDNGNCWCGREYPCLEH